MKSTVYVSVIGRPSSGKTTVMQRVMEAMTAANIEAEAMWGIDGPPRALALDAEKRKVASVSRKTKVVVTEVQASRNYNPEKTGDIKVQVVNDVEKGYQVRIIVLEVPMVANFGDFPLSRERALAVANRIAMELGIDVVETTVTKSTVSLGT